MTGKPRKHVERLLNDRRVDDIHKKSVTNALRHGHTGPQAKVVIIFLKSLISFRRSVVELIEDFARDATLFIQ